MRIRQPFQTFLRPLPYLWVGATQRILRGFAIEGAFELDGPAQLLLADRFDGAKGAIRVKVIEAGQPDPKGNMQCS